jgi:phosphoribosyl-AMP cyclohydrolase / phosphoribosyl-ATP pyrophosphohydrolase
MLIPSIDVQAGQAVQLRQGRDLVLTADTPPADLLTTFNRYGDVAIIDLDAARSCGDNLELIKQLCGQGQVRVGGGIRDVGRARTLLRAGAKQLIIGTAATPEFLSLFAPKQLQVALDHDAEGRVLDHGWTNTTADTLLERAHRLAPYCSSYLLTFVEHEGGLGGLSPDVVKALQAQLPHPITVAGGVNTSANAAELAKLGVDVQVGMALYQGLLDPTEVMCLTLDFDKQQGLIPTVVQDADTQQVLMLAYSSPESLRVALAEGKGIYYSRSRQGLWEKGGTSGHTQQLLYARYDCDRDALLFTVRQVGPTCHTGADTCWGPASFTLSHLWAMLAERKAHPTEGSYTATLFANKHKLHKKVIEEAFEATQATTTDEQVWELADAFFFLSVLAVAEGVDWSAVLRELAGRQRA